MSEPVATSSRGADRRDAAWSSLMDFHGRASRAEFWRFVLVALAIGAVLWSLPVALLDPEVDLVSIPAWLPFHAYRIAVLVPLLAVTARRLHDQGRTGWWALLVLLPFVGWAAVVVFACLAGTPGPNRYGPEPREQAAERAGVPGDVG